MNQKNISIICIALCLILIGGYILRQNYLLEKAYKTAGIYDYIPAEESKIILEIEQVSQIDSITSRLPILRRVSPIVMAGNTFFGPITRNQRYNHLFFGNRGSCDLVLHAPTETKKSKKDTTPANIE